MIQNELVKTWLAADCPAKAKALPILPTQKRSTAPINGLMAKFAMAGRDTCDRKTGKFNDRESEEGTKTGKKNPDITINTLSLYRP